MVPDKQLSLLNWNIEGLLSKSDLPGFKDFLASFDIICLTETFLQYPLSTKILGDDYETFSAEAKKVSYFGRASGGVMSLVHKRLLDKVHRLDTCTDNAIVFKIDKQLLYTEKDLIMVHIYIPPIQSTYYKDNKDKGLGIELLEDCIEQLLEIHDAHLLICGDLNARTENLNSFIDTSNVLDPTSKSDMIERHSEDKESNTFGGDLIDFCNMFDCCILNGSILDNQRIFDSNFTFISHQGNSVVDYYIVSTDLLHTQLFQSLRVLTRVESAHMPVSLSVKVVDNTPCFETSEPDQESGSVQRVMWDKEREVEYLAQLRTRALQEDIARATQLTDHDIDSALSVFTESVLTASKCMMKTIKFKTRKPRERKNLWFDDQCRTMKAEAVQLLKTFRKSLLDSDKNKYLDKRKEYQTLIRRKKAELKNMQLEKLENAQKDAKSFWKDIRFITGRPKAGICEKITHAQWVNHFRQVFSVDGNQTVDENLQLRQPSARIDQHSLEHLNRPMELSEVRKVVQSLKNDKSGGLDKIVNEMLKKGKSELENFLLKCFNAVFNSGVYPEAWRVSAIVPIHKKGSLDTCANYRGISLLSCLNKCFTSILNQRLYTFLECNKIIVEEQAGFRKKYSTVDHIFTLNAAIEKQFSVKGKKLYVAFVDLRRAFDSVHREILLKVLENSGISGKFIQVLKTMYEAVFACVRTGNMCTDTFKCERGVRQGCNLSPTIFSVFINQIALEINETGRHGITFLTGMIELYILLFADDLALMSYTVVGLQTQLNVLLACCTKLQLEINTDKTKVMVFRRGGPLAEKEKWYLGKDLLEVVNRYVYLGYMFTTKMSYNVGTGDLVSKARIATMGIFRLLKSFPDVSYSTFFKIFDTKVQPILMYSAELWGHTRLDSIERVHLLACKRFLGVPRSTPNKIVYGDIGRYPLYIASAVKLIKYWFKLLSMSRDRLPRQAYDMLLGLDERGKQCWASEVRVLLFSAGFSEVWLHQGVGNINQFITTFKQRLMEFFIQECFDTIENRDRYRNYRSFKMLFYRELYVTIQLKHHLRSMYSMLRAGMLPVNANRYRYKEDIRLQYCSLCHTVENEHHLLFVCPLYAAERRKLNNKIPLQNLDGNYIGLLRQQNKQRIVSLAAYISKVLEIRANFMEAS